MISQLCNYSIIYNTLQKDTSNSEKEAVEHIYRQLRNADPPDYETAKGVFEKLFFSDARYDLGEVGRYRLNKKLNLDTAEESRVLTKNDIISIIKYLKKISYHPGLLFLELKQLKLLIKNIQIGLLV